MRTGNLTTKEHWGGGGGVGVVRMRALLYYTTLTVSLYLESFPDFTARTWGFCPPFQPHFKLLSLCAFLSFLLALQDFE